jgi:hypothetical protein
MLRYTVITRANAAPRSDKSSRRVAPKIGIKLAHRLVAQETFRQSAYLARG